MKKENSTVLWCVMLLTGCLLHVALFAQPDPPGGPVPVDGGIALLVAAGAAYGIKKFKNIKNQ